MLKARLFDPFLRLSDIELLGNTHTMYCLADTLEAILVQDELTKGCSV